MTNIIAEETFEVFARRDSRDSLQHIGSVKAPNADIAVTRAWYVYDQHTWSEMCIVPLAAMIPITEVDCKVRVKQV